MEFENIKKILDSEDPRDIEDLIESCPELVNTPFDDRWGRPTSLLLMLITRQADEAISLLLRKGADPADQPADVIAYWLDSNRSTKPVNLECLRLLLEKGASLPLGNPRDHGRFIESVLRSACVRDDVALLKLFAEYGMNPAEQERELGRSVMGEAVRLLANRGSNQIGVLGWLLEEGCNIDGGNSEHEVPLYVAISGRCEGLAKWLLEKGASPGKLSKTILFLMSEPWRWREGLPTWVKELAIASGADFNAEQNGMTALEMAAQNDHAEFVQFAADNGVNVGHVGSKGLTPLHYALQRPAKNVIKTLMDLGVDLNVPDEKGNTPLDIVVALPNTKQLAAKMIKAGAKTGPELRGEKTGEVSANDELTTVIKKGEPWADRACDIIGSLDNEKVAQWNQLLRLCLECSSTKPSKKWLKDANALVDAIGETLFRSQLLMLFPLVKEKRTAELENLSEYEYYYGDQSHVIVESNTRIVRSLAWLASRFVDAEMSRALRELAANMYKKVYGVGMRNAKLGNAAVYSLSQLPGNTGLKEIIILRSVTKYNPALVNINRVFDKLAEARDLTPDELAELAIPDYGLNGIGSYQEKIGDFEACLTLVKVGKTELVWKNASGKIQKSVPAAVKQEHPDFVKQLKAMVKDVQTGSSAHAQRLEQMYLRAGTLTLDTWNEQYINHPLIGFLARRLIWRLRSGETLLDVMHTDSGYVDCHNSAVSLPDDFEVMLWHPTMSSADEVLAWRTWLIEHEVTQPFKQAHREIYLLTDAERQTATYSMRFANHILTQAQFHALATQRGWSQTRGGSWDGGQENSAYKRVSAFNVMVEFEATGSEAYGDSDTGMYECVATERVIFRRNGDLPLQDLDPLMFSEVMRDVDLFVGVASVGNDPEWRDREAVYWQNASFGELNAQAETRRDVLTALIPKLKISKQLSIDGRFLIVKGKLRTYKIHLGSSNIMMEPNNSYLCIVETKSSSDVMLPFEGDRTLSLVLSKAFLLAQDDKIKDKTILSQINHKGAA